MPARDVSIPVETFKSERHFQIWRYEVGHVQLLLRSVKNEGDRSRIDVLFKDVKAIDLPTSFDGLDVKHDGEQFVASGVGWSGRVIAGACFQAEDIGEYFDPSPFAHSLLEREQRPVMPLMWRSIVPTSAHRAFG